jgi:transposase
VATLAVTRRFDLTDEQWARLAPLLPVVTKPGRPSKWTKRQLIDGIRWRVRVGAPWRDVPDCCGSWQAVYSLFRRWQRAGVWQRIVTALRHGPMRWGLIGWEVSVDSTVARAHQHAAGARTRPDEPADHALGRSRGGLTTKIHLACEQGQKVMSLLVTAGQRGDSPQFQAVLEAISVPRLGAGRPRTRPDRVRADNAYSSRADRAYLRRRGIGCTIPPRPTRSVTARTGAPGAAGRRSSARSTTGGVTPSSAASTGSTPPRRRYAIRQARRPLRSHPPHRHHQRLAADLTLGHALVDAPWDAYIAAPGDDPTLRETTFGGGRGLLSFRVDDDAEMIHVFAISWIG